VTTRVYVPSTLDLLRGLLSAGLIGPAPFVAHAVTDAVRSELADVGEEEWEYAASTAAAQSAVGLLHPDEPPRRVVLAVDVPAVRGAGLDDPTVVEVDEVVPFHRIDAVLADSQDAERAVAAARDALHRDAPDAAVRLDRCLDHELGWWAAQELGELLDGGGDR
jgi:hypothetical protein